VANADFQEEPPPSRPYPQVERADEDVPYRREPIAHGDATGGLIPYKNPTALIGYYLGVFGLIPCLGLVLGPAALILGIIGLRHANRHPEARGIGHAITAIVLGTLATLGNAAVLFLAFGGAFLSSFR
jgi:hypothetical protein